MNTFGIQLKLIKNNMIFYRFDETGTDGEPLIKNVKILKKLQLWKQKI